MSQKTPEQTRQYDFFNVCGSCPISCCSDVRPPVTSRRMGIVQDYLKANNISVERPFEKNMYSFPRETADRLCVFLNKNAKKCRIHPVKPETCAAGPVTFDINLKTGKIVWFLKTEKKRLCSWWRLGKWRSNRPSGFSAFRKIRKVSISSWMCSSTSMLNTRS